MNQPNLAPVVLFVYGRPIHTQRTIDALLQNPESKDTDLIVYSDGPKQHSDTEKVESVRDIIKKTSGFKSINLIERTENLGLSANIIDGVTKVCEEYGKVIVLEDDIVTSPFFLNFMNSALNKYQSNEKVWHISGWNYPLKNTEELPETFFWRTMNCWGWATWKDRWQHFEKSPQKLVTSWDQETIQKFNLDGYHNFWSQVEENISGKLNTWAIFWYATIFSHKGLCLNPTTSFVANIGNDGSGENCGNIDIYRHKINQKTVSLWPNVIEENMNIVSLIKFFYKTSKPSFIRRILSKIKRVLS
ncbi:MULTISPECIES: glycosyltransferase [Providencia]|uniref:Glycosyltransferase n=1 Tax=Providencia rustigianii TaxID=158850 RepID=A0A346CLH0_9GAMM|nr:MULTISPECIES: glycosyltransferase [Providencia]AXL96444.1 glycosyltransferase [Providencia rustigianii]MTC55630.1 glycosyltransferase [Providencia rustigianii]